VHEASPASFLARLSGELLNASLFQEMLVTWSLALASDHYTPGGPHRHDENLARNHARCPGAGVAMLYARPTPLIQWTRVGG
jgi:hypothetical protein